jgi:hypothetical protein
MKQIPSFRKWVVLGQPSWRIQSSHVEAFVTELGGHLAPVVFDRGQRRIQPYALPPWWNERLPPHLPPVIKVLRGDFFCLPFGGNAEPFRGERHQVHGETANRKWKFESLKREAGRTTLHLSLKTTVRRGRVDKSITLVEGHNAVYCQHIVSGMSGPMDFGHHAMLKFPDQPGSGILTHSAIKFSMVSVLPLENAETFGYSMLKPGAKFSSLDRVPTMTSGRADLTRYPARRGFEDLVLLATKQSEPCAWVAVTFPEQRYVWFALKDPQVLRQTALWHSNGGRHYPPWSGRHLNVLGIEDLTGFFHYGLAQSARRNRLNELGEQTCFTLTPDQPLKVNYIMAVATVPRDFADAASIEPANNWQSVKLISSTGKTVNVPLCADFVRTGTV